MFAIIRHGYGKRTRYTLRKMVVRFFPWGACVCDGCSAMIPEIGIHKTVESIRAAAEKLGYKIVACGDFYEVAATIRETVHA